MKRRVRVAVAAAVALLVVLPATASAHPLGNFSINHYAGLVVRPGAVELDVVIDMAEIPTLTEIALLDTDGDGRVSGDELEASRETRCEALIPNLGLTIDDAPLRLGLTAAGLHLRSGSGGLDTLRLVCELTAPLATPLRSGSVVTFSDGSSPERIGWREIVVRGDGVTIDDPEAGVDIANRLTAYPEDLLARPLDERSASVVARPGGPPLAGNAPIDATAVGGSRSAEPIGAPTVVAGIDLTNLTPALAALGIVLAAAAGAGHALSPGHGKTIMAAYLIGTRGRRRDAVMLGGVITASHTVGVLALAGVVLFAGGVIPPERLYPVLSAIAGLTVIVVGGVMLARCVQRWRLTVRAHDEAHAHGHPHGHVHEHPHPHEDRGMPGWRGLAAIGVAGGMIPSTSALVLLLGAIAAGEPAYGLALALAFGAGMAGVLAGIGLALVHGRDRIGRLMAGAPRLSTFGAILPWGTAVVVLASGVLLTGQALLRPGL